jgi:hypothetical protein
MALMLRYFIKFRFISALLRTLYTKDRQITA